MVEAEWIETFSRRFVRQPEYESQIFLLEEISDEDLRKMKTVETIILISGDALGPVTKSFIVEFSDGSRVSYENYEMLQELDSLTFDFAETKNYVKQIINDEFSKRTIFDNYELIIYHK